MQWFIVIVIGNCSVSDHLFVLQGELQHRRSTSGRALAEAAASLHKRPVSVGVCPLAGIVTDQAAAASDLEMTETVKMFSCEER